METTLITGASSGIGLHLANEFARNGHDLVLVAPVEAELLAQAAELRNQHRINVTVFAKDLREAAAIEEIAMSLSETQVDILVNNAGVGQRGKSWEIELEEDISMIRLNIEATIRLTKYLLPPMIARGKGRILNTASIAGFEPGPLYAVYSATKAFVLSYTEALATELKETGVTATALCPGPTDTDFFIKADMLETKSFQQASLMAPQEVAEAGYKAVMDGQRVIVPGGFNKATVFARRFLTESQQAKLNEILMSEVPPEKQKRERGDMEFGLRK